jgi:hypothetical protein
MTKPTTIRCANPACRDALRGKPRFLARALLAPGGMLELAGCPRCGFETRVVVDAAGRLSLGAAYRSLPRAA